LAGACFQGLLIVAHSPLVLPPLSLLQLVTSLVSLIIFGLDDRMLWHDSRYATFYDACDNELRYAFEGFHLCICVPCIKLLLKGVDYTLVLVINWVDIELRCRPLVATNRDAGTVFSGLFFCIRLPTLSRLFTVFSRFMFLARKVCLCLALFVNEVDV
jgi:hypothetical protein